MTDINTLCEQINVCVKELEKLSNSQLSAQATANFISNYEELLKTSKKKVGVDVDCWPPEPDKNTYLDIKCYLKQLSVILQNDSAYELYPGITIG